MIVTDIIYETTELLNYIDSSILKVFKFFFFFLVVVVVGEELKVVNHA